MCTYICVVFHQKPFFSENERKMKKEASKTTQVFFKLIIQVLRTLRHSIFRYENLVHVSGDRILGSVQKLNKYRVIEKKGVKVNAS